MQARYNGTCVACGKAIVVGQEITWNRAIKGSTRHVDCDILAPKTYAVDAKDEDGRIAIAVGEDGIAHIVTPETVASETIKPTRKYTRKASTEAASESDSTSKPLDKVSSNAPWYDVLGAILPHVSRILLVGPPATGKSTTAMKVSGARFRVTMTETTSREELIGMFQLIDGETKWVDGPITSAMRNGECVLVDEIDRYSPEAASLLYALIDDKPHLSLPNGEMLYSNPGYKMIMTSNDGLDTLPVAVQDRIEVILQASEPHADAIADMPQFMQNVTTAYYRMLPKPTIKLPTTVRRMRTFHGLLANGLDSKLAATITFGQHAEILSVLSSAENALNPPKTESNW